MDQIKRMSDRTSEEEDFQELIQLWNGCHRYWRKEVIKYSGDARETYEPNINICKIVTMALHKRVNDKYK